MKAKVTIEHGETQDQITMKYTYLNGKSIECVFDKKKYQAECEFKTISQICWWNMRNTTETLASIEKAGLTMAKFILKYNMGIDIDEILKQKT